MFWLNRVSLVQGILGHPRYEYGNEHFMRLIKSFPISLTGTGKSLKANTRKRFRWLPKMTAAVNSLTVYTLLGPFFWLLTAPPDPPRTHIDDCRSYAGTAFSRRFIFSDPIIVCLMHADISSLKKEKNGLLCEDEDWKPFAFKIPYYIVKFGTSVEYSLRST